VPWIRESLADRYGPSPIFRLRRYRTQEWTRLVQYVALVLACLLNPFGVACRGLVFIQRAPGESQWLDHGRRVGQHLFWSGLSAFIFPEWSTGKQDIRENLALEKAEDEPFVSCTASNSLLNFAIYWYFTTNVRTIDLLTLAMLAMLLVLYASRCFVSENTIFGKRVIFYAVATTAPDALTGVPSLLRHRHPSAGRSLAYPGIMSQATMEAWISLCLLGLLYFSWERRIHLDHLSGVQLKLAAPLYFRGMLCSSSYWLHLLSEMLTYKRLRSTETC